METKEPDSRLSVRKEDLDDKELYRLNQVINDLYSKVSTARDETADTASKFVRSGVITSPNDQSTSPVIAPVEAGIPQPASGDWSLNTVVYSAGEDGLQYGFASASISNKSAAVDYYSMFIQDYSSGYVDTNGTSITLTAASKDSGNTFENCVAGQVININGVAYTLASTPTSPYESVTLTTSAGTQSNKYFNLNPVDGGKWEEIASDAEAGTWQLRPPTGWDVPCCLTASTKDQKVYQPADGVNYKRLVFAAWADAPQVTNFSVSVEQQDPTTTDIPGGKFVVNFTKPLDPEYYYASIERLWLVYSSGVYTGNIGATAIVDVSGNTVTYNSTSTIYSDTFKGQLFNNIQPGDTVYIASGSVLPETSTYIVSEVISNTQLKLTTNPPAGTERLFAQWGRMAGEVNPFTQTDYWPLPVEKEYWRFRARSVNNREIANNTAPPSVVVEVPASGGITPLTPSTQPTSGQWSLNALQYSINEAGNSYVFISATVSTPSPNADYYSLFWQQTATPTSGQWIEIAADSKAGTWRPWPPDGATYVVAIAANKNTYKLDQPDETIPSYYKTLTIPPWNQAAQVTGFSVTVETDNRAGVPSGRFVFNFTKPSDPNYYYAKISRIATDSSYTPLSGATYGLVAGEIDPTKQTDWWPLPGTAEYWKFKCESVNYRKEVNTTSAPTSNVSVSTSSGITQVAPATLTTAAFASTIRPVELFSSLPALPSSSYPQGAVVFLTTNNKLYRSTGSTWTVATDGADIVANSITTGKIAAGAISTTELYAGEILVGGAGGKPTRFTVKDSSNNTIGFIGDNGAGFIGAYLINLRVGTDINNPVILADSLGVSINGAPLTLNLNGITATINNGLDSIGAVYAGLRVTNNTSGWYTSYRDTSIALTNGSLSRVFISAGGGSPDPGGYINVNDTSGVAKITLIGGTGAATCVNLTASGTITFPTGATNGYVWTSNASGVGSWQSISSVSAITSINSQTGPAVTIAASTGISISSATNTVTITNTGVTSLTAGTGISLSASTGSVTVTNSGVTSLTGTTNQVNVSASTGSITLSLPQSINTTATPTFTAVIASAIGTNSTTALDLKTDSTVRWSVSSTGMFIPSAADTYDIGILSTNRVRGVYAKYIETSQAGAVGDYVKSRLIRIADQAGGSGYWDVFADASVIGSSDFTIKDNSGSRLMVGWRAFLGTAVNYTYWYSDIIPQLRSTAGGDAVNDLLYPSLGSSTYPWGTVYSSQIYVYGTVNSDLVPFGTNSYDLGDSTYRWASLWTVALNISGALTANGSAGSSGQLLSTTGSVAQWVNVTSQLTAGTGISITGTTNATITNSGVTSLTGTSNQVTVSASTGSVTLSLPQSIATTSGVTFGSLIVSGATTFNGTATHNASLAAGTTDTYDIGSSTRFRSIYSKTTNSESIEVANGATVTSFWRHSLSGASTYRLASGAGTQIELQATVISSSNTQFGLRGTVYPLDTTGSNGDLGYSGTPWRSLYLNGLISVNGSSGSSGQFLSTTGSLAQWVNVTSQLTAGTGISITGTTNATITNSGVTSLTGTSNQVTVSASTGSVTLSLPQSIATTSSVTFNSVTLANGDTSGISIKDSGGTPRVVLTLASNNNLYLDNNDGGYDIYIRPASGRYTFVDGSYFAPYTNNAISLGYNGQGWSNVYSYAYYANNGSSWVAGATATADFTASGGFTVGGTTYYKLVFNDGILTGYTT